MAQRKIYIDGENIVTMINCTHHSSYEEIPDAAEYLKTEYKDLIGLDNPQINIYGGDYNIYSQQGYRIEFFEANGSDTEQIINYNFNRVAFECNDERKLFLAKIYQPDLSEVVDFQFELNCSQSL